MSNFFVNKSEDFKLFTKDISQNSYTNNVAFHAVVESVLDYYSLLCKKFDSAPDLSCMEKTYEVNEPILNEEIDVIQELLYRCSHYEDNREIPKKILQIIGRFIFSHISVLRNERTSSNTRIKKFVKGSFFFLLHHEWSYDDAIFVRLTIYNLLDILHPPTTSNVFEIVSRDELSEANEISRDLIYDAVNKYLHQTKVILPIKADWIYAYIYKTRFGYIYCKKFTRQNTKSSLPFTLQAYSMANKGLIPRTIQNSAKVVAFEIGEVKRSSEYRPKEDSFLYNFTTMKFE